MTKAKDLDRLLALRESRLQRAEGALATQHARCETARSQAEAAAARILAHRDHQDEDERALLDGLVGRTVTLGDIERVRTAFALLEEQAADLERARQEAERAKRAAFELKQVMALDRHRRRREHERMSQLVLRMARATRHKAELYDEVEQEDGARDFHNSERRRPC